MAGEMKCKSTVDVEYYIQLNLPDKANECLIKLIDQDPANPKLNLPKLRLLRGEYCLKQGNTSCARERFSIDAVKQQYGKDIAALYRKAGDAKLDAGSMQQADNLYSEAMSYDPAMKDEITNSLFLMGKQTGRADGFLLSTKYNPSLKPAVADHYYNLSVAATNNEDRTDLLGKAADFDIARYGSKFTNSKLKLGRSYLDKAVAYAKQPGKEEECERCNKLARKYLGDPIVDKELPDIKYFGEGLHSLGTYKAGEQTPYWFTSLAGSFNTYIIMTNGNRNFTVITRTHERFNFVDDAQRKDYLSRNWADIAIKIQFQEPMECTLRVAKK
jgi:hypothetical protein